MLFVYSFMIVSGTGKGRVKSNTCLFIVRYKLLKKGLVSFYDI